MEIILIFIYGLIIGSFLNALIWRLHSGESMMDRSRCPECHAIIRWFDNIPLLSYALLRGRCRQCKEKISIQYPLVELATALLFVLAWQHAISSYFLPVTFYLLLFKSWLVVAVMVIIFVYDLRWYLILDKVTWPAGTAFFLLWLVEKSQAADLWQAKNAWLELFLAVLIGYGFFALQYYGSKGKWLGGGDVKLGVVMALALATPSRIMAAIFVAYILGALVGIGLIIAGKKETGSKLPFGTFLAVATVIIYFWGEAIINWYAKLAGF